MEQSSWRISYRQLPEEEKIQAQFLPGSIRYENAIHSG
jgi:hypothetical protein